MTLLAELKRRNVIRMAGLYLVGRGWSWPRPRIDNIPYSTYS